MQSSPIICPLPISPSLSLVIYMSYTPTQRVKNLPAIREAQDQFLDQEDLLKKAMATHSTILAWRIPCTEEPGRLQSVGSQRIGNGWVTKHFHFCFTHDTPRTLCFLNSVLLWVLFTDRKMPFVFTSHPTPPPPPQAASAHFFSGNIL